MVAHRKRMQTWCEGIQTETGVEAFHLVLGGGYGRGEGGVSVDEKGQAHAHNDLDYFLFVESLEDVPDLVQRIRAIEHIESELLAVDVEIQALPLSSIKGQAHTLMMADLANGRDTVFGDVSDYLKNHTAA